MKRRLFLKSSVATGTLTAAAGYGLLPIQTASAASYPSDAFAAEDATSGASTVLGMDAASATESDDIKLKAPEVAENGAVVPIKISTNGATEMIAVVVEKNPAPLVMTAKFSDGASGALSGRIKMGQTSNVIAYAKMGDKLVKATAEVKVTAGGCGG